jgi:hypothetical protein
MFSAGIFLPLPFKTQLSVLQTFTIAKKTAAHGEVNKIKRMYFSVWNLRRRMKA